jgi:hypothetical protein
LTVVLDTFQRIEEFVQKTYTELYMKVSLPILIAWLAVSCPSWADEQDRRFVEFPNSTKTITYDLSTAQLIQPGKFSVMSTTIDNPDTMKLELKVLSALRQYCSSPDGKYSAPADVFTLGPPDMPVENIKVESGNTKIADRAYPYKIVSWSYPYIKFALKFEGHPAEQMPAVLDCKQIGRTENELYLERYSSITNGHRSKELFDCKRGLAGIFLNEDDDLAKAMLGPVRPDTYIAQYYDVVCYRVTHEMPYQPK